MIEIAKKTLGDVHQRTKERIAVTRRERLKDDHGIDPKAGCLLQEIASPPNLLRCSNLMNHLRIRMEDEGAKVHLPYES